MEQSRRELLVSRVISGVIRLKIDNKIVMIKSPTKLQYYCAQEIYNDVLEQSVAEGLYTETELYNFLITNKLWTEKKEKMISDLVKNIDNFKVELFKLVFKSAQRQVVKQALKISRDKLQSLYSERSSYDHLSCKGNASLARLKYLVSCSSYNDDDSPIFNEKNFWFDSSELLDIILSKLSENKLDDSDIRELARTDPWRSIWGCRKTDNLFNIPAIDYTNEQRNLVNWSILYDNIFEHPDCPDEKVIEDDDMLDGWLIEQRNKRESGKGNNVDDLIGNEKIRNSQEIFLPADTVEDAVLIDNLNDGSAKNIKHTRIKTIQQKGFVNEADMPDTKRQIQMDKANLERNAIRG